MGGAFAWTERVAAKVDPSHLNYAPFSFVPGSTDVPDRTGHLSRLTSPGHRYDVGVRSEELLTARQSQEAHSGRRRVRPNKRAIHLLFGVLEVDRPGDLRHDV